MHPAGTVIASVLLAMFSALLGVWMAGLYDVLRIGALDTELANRFGYIGEITDSTEDPLLQGISREAMVTIFLVAIIGWPITYAWLVVARRQIGDPNAIEGAFAAALLGAAFGFLWLSMDWAAPRPGHWALWNSSFDTAILGPPHHGRARGAAPTCLAGTSRRPADQHGEITPWP